MAHSVKFKELDPFCWQFYWNDKYIKLKAVIASMNKKLRTTKGILTWKMEEKQEKWRCLSAL